MSKEIINHSNGSGPSFFESWNSQRYKPLGKDFRLGDGMFLIAGLPKSGNVWLTSLVANCLDLPVTVQDGQSSVSYTHKGLTSEVLHDPKILRGVVLVRDLRDIIVSLYHWLGTEDYLSYFKHGPHQIFGDLESMYIEYFLRRFSHIPIDTLVDDYVKLGWPVIKYENLWDNAMRELTRLFAVWQIEVSEEKIARAVEQNSIKVLRNSQQSATIDSSIKRDHFRAGGYGQFRNEIPEHILSDIERRYGNYLRSWGYVCATV